MMISNTINPPYSVIFTYPIITKNFKIKKLFLYGLELLEGIHEIQNKNIDAKEKGKKEFLQRI